MGTVPTIRVRRKDGDSGSFIINASDFIPGEHEKVGDVPAAPPAPPANAPEPGSAHDNSVAHVAGREITSLRDVIAEQAVQVIFTLTDIEQLKRLRDEERAHPKYAGGRKSVIDGFAVRLQQFGIED